METAKFCGNGHTESVKYFCHVLLELNKSGYDKICKVAQQDFKSKTDLMMWISQKLNIGWTESDIIRDKSQLQKQTQPTQQPATAKTDTTENTEKNVISLKQYIIIRKIVETSKLYNTSVRNALEVEFKQQEFPQPKIDYNLKLYDDYIIKAQQPQKPIIESLGL